MLIFKFGGASVKDSFSVKNLLQIVKSYNKKIIVIVSAMGKTTNALEQVAADYFYNRESLWDSWGKVKKYHMSILQELFPEPAHPVYPEVENIFDQVETKLKIPPGLNFDFEYDQLVCSGELLSTIIVSAALNDSGIKSRWMDIRVSLRTDESYREGKVNWEISEKLINKEFVFDDNSVLVTQGFIASTVNNQTTTLGREGSDYTAAILGYILEVQDIVIWKDVPGILNADPEYYPDAVLLPEISYRDAIELAYYGAKVIHPKTIQPLKRKNIRLHVRSFLNPAGTGTLIADAGYERLTPSFIFKEDQILIDFFPEDFSFVSEQNLEIILGCFARNNLRINLMQNSAISFRVCVNNDSDRISRIMRELEGQFTISSESGLELLTIRYYDDATVKKMTSRRECLLEQSNGVTMQVVMRGRGNIDHGS